MARRAAHTEINSGADRSQQGFYEIANDCSVQAADIGQCTGHVVFHIVAAIPGLTP